MTNRLELNWKLVGFVDEQRYYCSETPIDSENLPVPKAVLVGDVLTYVDTAVEAGKDYYVAISSVKNGVEKISEIVSVSTWTPSLIATAWYDFSDEHTVTVVDNAISQITDKSGNGKHLSQSIAVQRPAYSTFENGMKAAKFDGVNDFLGANVALLNVAHSLFIVFKPTIESATGSLFGQWAAGQTGRYVLSTNQNSAGETPQGRLNPFNSTATDGGDTYGYMGDFAITNEATIIESICTTGFKNWKVYKNGLLMDSATVASLYTGVNSAIGSVSASQISNPYDGHVGEIIIVDSVVDTETRQKIEGYLAHKWGVAI